MPQEPRMKTAPTQPFPVGDSFVPTCPEPGSVDPKYPTSCIFGVYWTEPVVMAPGTQGGLSWAPMAFNPATGFDLRAGQHHQFGVLACGGRNGTRARGVSVRSAPERDSSVLRANREVER